MRVRVLGVKHIEVVAETDAERAILGEMRRTCDADGRIEVACWASDMAGTYAIGIVAKDGEGR